MNNQVVYEKDIRAFFIAIFKKIGVKKSIYIYVIEGLIETSLRGVDSHGIRLMPHYIKAVLLGRINKNPKMSFMKTCLSTVVMDADHTFGIAAGNIAMQKAIAMARKSGICAIAVKNSTHFGAAAIYSLLAARNGMIGISFTHADSLVLPYGGKRPFLGTNPICFAAPCEGEEPFCLDMATSKIPWNKLLVYKDKKQPLEDGWAADRDGKVTRNPEDAIGLLPIADYKGYGLGLMVEILCSLLSGMAYGPHIKPMYPLDEEKRFLGHFFIAIDITKFERLPIFKKRLSLFMNELRQQPPSAGFESVKIPGDPEKKAFAKRSKEGIPILKEQLDDFVRVANEMGINKNFIRPF